MDLETIKIIFSAFTFFTLIVSSESVSSFIKKHSFKHEFLKKLAIFISYALHVLAVFFLTY